MTMETIELLKTSKQLAYDIINLYRYLTEDATLKEFNLSKQLLLSGTRIGDHIRQENLLNAYHSAYSAKYWLDLLNHGGFLDDNRHNSIVERLVRLAAELYVRSHTNQK